MGKMDQRPTNAKGLATSNFSSSPSMQTWQAALLAALLASAPANALNESSQNLPEPDPSTAPALPSELPELSQISFTFPSIETVSPGRYEIQNSKAIVYAGEAVLDLEQGIQMGIARIGTEHYLTINEVPFQALSSGKNDPLSSQPDIIPQDLSQHCPAYLTNLSSNGVSTWVTVEAPNEDTPTDVLLRFGEEAAGLLSALQDGCVILSVVLPGGYNQDGSVRFDRYVSIFSTSEGVDAAISKVRTSTAEQVASSDNPALNDGYEQLARLKEGLIVIQGE